MTEEQRLKRHRDRMRKYYAANPELARAACRRWADKNRDYLRERNRQWRARNRDRVRTYNRSWREANSDYHTSWRKTNLERCRTYLANYRGRKAFATPLWADADAISEVYADAVARSKTGIPHEVDHIIPLGGKYVCGLHVQGNLRVIPASENRAKGNRFDADQPG